MIMIILSIRKNFIYATSINFLYKHFETLRKIDSVKPREMNRD